MLKSITSPQSPWRNTCKLFHQILGHHSRNARINPPIPSLCLPHLSFTFSLSWWKCFSPTWQVELESIVSLPLLKLHAATWEKSLSVMQSANNEAFPCNSPWLSKWSLNNWTSINSSPRPESLCDRHQQRPHFLLAYPPRASPACRFHRPTPLLWCRSAA